ncbi:ATP-dependent DNA helicase [Trichonephila clavipes]|nr:ATP-dependent DNA helicase [Trichonephila clavipes]
MARAKQKPSFLQIYFMGDDHREKDIRCGIYPGIKPELISQLQKSLHEHNKYIMDFKAAIDSVPKDQKEFKTKEVAVVIVGQEFEKRDIVLSCRSGTLMRINETHRAYDALQYPLMFFRGGDGYQINIPKRHETTEIPQSKTVSASEFYSYRIMERHGEREVCYLLLFRNLLNQFLVDMFAKIETERLNWIRHNQKKLRSEEYIHLKEAITATDGQLSELGKMVVLPSSFTGGSRYMHERTQDAMTYVRHFGRPDLFITFTCNPKWSEIVDLLNQGQKSHDRHDIIARVFRVKVKHMMRLLTKGCIFGNVRCHMYTCEGPLGPHFENENK